VRLVLVTDHKEFAEKIRVVCGQEHYLGTFLTPDSLLQTNAQSKNPLDYDCAICDLEVFSRLRSEFKNPIFVLSTMEATAIWRSALQQGADAVLFTDLPAEAAMEQILAFMRRWQRDKGATRRHLTRFDLLIDLERYRVELNGKVLDLTLTELKVLKELASDDDQVIPRMAIQQEVFGQLAPGNRSLDVHVCSLRKKLRPHGLDVESVRGVGYRLLPHGSRRLKAAGAANGA
jgi:DNA-binding response OmpR family regulator